MRFVQAGLQLEGKKWQAPFSSGAGPAQSPNIQPSEQESPFQAVCKAFQSSPRPNPWADTANVLTKDEVPGPKHLLPGVDSIWAPMPSKPQGVVKAKKVIPVIVSTAGQANDVLCPYQATYLLKDSINTLDKLTEHVSVQKNPHDSITC